jgi:hypothetical protein
MTKYAGMLLVAFGCLIHPAIGWAQNPHLVVYQGDKGPGAGKHIVWLAGDHEYRGEESLPALARIMAKHYGFKCSVFFTTNPATGFIEPGSSNLSGLEALKTADLLVVFLRFQDFPDAEMQHIVTISTGAALSSAIARRRMPFRSSGPTRSSSSTRGTILAPTTRAASADRF